MNSAPIGLDDRPPDAQSILIVDDEPINLKLLRAHLSKRGYEVFEALSGAEALRDAAEKHPDLILLDIMMPDMDGLETCRQLKEDPTLRQIPVIFLSAVTDTGIKAKGLEAGGVDYVSKPFDSRELLARVDTHLTLRNQERQIRLYADNLEAMVEERTKRLQAAEWELLRDYDIQSVLNSLLRMSMDNVSLSEMAQVTLDRILSVSWLPFLGKGCIFLADESAQKLRIIAKRNLDEQTLAHHSELAYGDCSCGRAALERTMIVVPGDDPARDGQAAEEPYGKLCMPVLYDQELLGLISIHLKHGHAPDDKEKEFFTAVANTMARIIMYSKAEEQLKDSEEQYRTIFENTGTAMAILKDDTTIALANSTYEKLSLVPRKNLEGLRTGLEFIHEKDRQRLYALHRRIVDQSDQKPASGEFRFLSSNGDVRDVAMTISRLPGARGNVVSISDITDKKRAEEQLIHNAYHDSLTGLPNRSMVTELLAEEVRAAKGQPGRCYALLLIDLDRFSIINEGLGHVIGDRLLMALASRLRNSVGKDGVLARLGGDEFAILMTDTGSHAKATEMAERILQSARQPFVLDGYELFTTSSLGIAVNSIVYDRPEDLIRDADTALHMAKEKGKARYEVFDPEMHRRAINLMELVTDLRQAVVRKEFFLNYQPIVCLRTGKVTGFEALIRWNHPRRGLVNPAEFIPVAEETGLIIPIGEWVLGEACTRMGRLFAQCCKGEDCPMLSVNISGKQFAHGDVFERTREALAASALPPHCLKLEITETAIMENAEVAVETLKRLKSLNVQVSIDDFGTGYSSLSYLHRFPVDMLKIDRSFVSRISNRDENLEIVRTIVALAHSMGLKVIAEGVETAEEADILRELGCEYVQGFFYARPMDEAVLVEKGIFTCLA